MSDNMFDQILLEHTAIIRCPPFQQAKQYNMGIVTGLKVRKLLAKLPVFLAQLRFSQRSLRTFKFVARSLICYAAASPALALATSFHNFKRDDVVFAASFDGLSACRTI